MECLVQRTGILMSEFDARVNRIQVAYEGFLDAPLHVSKS